MGSEIITGSISFGQGGVTIPPSKSMKVIILSTPTGRDIVGNSYSSMSFEDVRVDGCYSTERYPLDFYAAPEPPQYDWYQQFYSKKKKGGTKSYNRSSGKRRR